MPDVTQRMLTRQLRELEADQVIHREVYPEVSPRVEYSLTEFGRTLEPILRMLQAWGFEYLEHISEIRAAWRDAADFQLCPLIWCRIQVQDSPPSSR